MAAWSRSSVVKKDLDELVAAELLHPLADGSEWLVPRDEPVPDMNDSYVVSFTPFHEQGVAVPPHDFLHAVLFHYGCELHHLNPSGI